MMQGDGNLVLSQLDVGAIWASGTTGGPLSRAQMQSDGNFAVVDYTQASAVAKWATNTAGHQGVYMAIQNDGNLVAYDSNHIALWASNTCCR
jgi:hypothetical protein